MFNQRVICFVIGIAMCLSMVSGGEVVTNHYHGIRPTDPQGFIGLPNPERGFRPETMIAEGFNTGYLFSFPESVKHVVPPDPYYTNERWILDAEMFDFHGITLVQTYCYLTEYRTQPISQAKLALLQKSFDHLRANGMKAALRFAYAKNMQGTSSATLSRILQHITQLTPIILANSDVIFSMEAGFIGAWGEWHSDQYIAPDDYDARAQIVKKLVDLLPGERQVQIRTPQARSNLLAEAIFDGQEDLYASRTGFSNDGFMSGTTESTWPEAPYFASPGNPAFDAVTEESHDMVVGGELYWSDRTSSTPTPYDTSDGLSVAIRLRLHHYSLFSIAHSYSVREGENYAIDHWTVNPITKQQLLDESMPVSDGYFENQFGTEVARTQFEYIRDHLGYRLELQQAVFPDEVSVGGNLTVNLELINRGFSTLHNSRNAYIVLIDMDGNVVEFDTGADPQQWQPFAPGDANYTPLVHQLGIQVTLPGGIEPGYYQLGFWMPDPYSSIHLDPQYAAQLANRDTFWWANENGEYGVNLFGVIEVE